LQEQAHEVSSCDDVVIASDEEKVRCYPL